MYARKSPYNLQIIFINRQAVVEFEKMGGSQSKSDETFRANQWQQAHDIQPPNQSIGQYVIVRNRITGELLDRYTLQFPNAQDYNKYLDSISYRRSQPNVVRVMHYEPKVVKQFCGSVYMLNVYLEHCRSRLVQYQDIPFPDYLYCAMAMLDGYKKLYNKVGRFFVSEQQVMIDQDGEIRVWLNSDYSQNQAEDFANENYASSNANQQQYQMVKDIMEMVFSNSDQSQGPAIKFADFYERQKHNYNGRVGFEQAKSITLDYMKMNNIEVLDIFKSVYEIYQAQQPRNNDALSFKNGLYDPDHQHDQPVRARLSGGGGAVHYEPVQSVLSNNSQTNRNISLQNTSLQNNIGPVVTGGFMSAINSHPQPYPQPQSAYMQHSRSALLQPPIKNNFVARPVYQSPPHQGRPIFQHPPIQPYPQPQLIQQGPRPQSQFPIVIKPTPGVNNRPNMPISHSLNHFPPNYQITQPRPFPQQIPLQPGRIISNQPQFQPNLINNFSPSQPPFLNKPAGNFDQNQRNKQKANNQYIDELEIQKNLLQKQANYHEDINQANIIRDLTQLHKIQQEERSKRSMNQDSSRNYNRNFQSEDGRYNEYNDHDHEHEHGHEHEHQQQRQDNYLEKAEHDIDGEYQQENYNEEEQIDNNMQTSPNNKQNTRVEQVQVQSYQPLIQNNTNISPFGNQQVNQQQQYFVPAAKPPIRHQISQPQYFSGFNPHLNNGVVNYNSVELNQANGFGVTKINQPNIIKNQINQMNKGNMQNQEISKKQSLGNSKKQFYYTLSNQIELDPEIAADLALFGNA